MEIEIDLDESKYARMFDETTTHQWENNPKFNYLFLQCQQRWCNDMLIARGHVFLNDVYDALGIKRTPAGALVGWLPKNDNKDGYIDFGIPECSDSDLPPLRFKLDFNVDGIIFDKIEVSNENSNTPSQSD